MRTNYMALIGALFILMIINSCGGSSSSSQSAPVISNLSYAPNQAALVSGGTVTVYATYDAVDSDANMSTSSITTYDPLGNAIHTSTDSIPFASGYTSRPVLAIEHLDTSQIGCYSFRVFVTDSTGLKSNELSGSVSIPFGACP